ncbi:hypothetical protein D1007_16556 [Hordeum vulgare]|nr:hypothetical protein D1007_16556 [Hordeum vulgare]
MPPAPALPRSPEHLTRQPWRRWSWPFSVAPSSGTRQAMAPSALALPHRPEHPHATGHGVVGPVPPPSPRPACRAAGHGAAGTAPHHPEQRHMTGHGAADPSLSRRRPHPYRMPLHSSVSARRGTPPVSTRVRQPEPDSSRTTGRHRISRHRPSQGAAPEPTPLSPTPPSFSVLNFVNDSKKC